MYIWGDSLMANERLNLAKKTKNDEFYTRYEDIEAEMNGYYEYNHDVFRGKTILLPCDDPEWSNFTKYFSANFKRFGIKKLISTSYAKSAGSRMPSLFEENSPLYNPDKYDTHGKLYVLTGDTDNSGIIDEDDVEFKGYLEGDGDFRSKEVTKLRDEADIIITNPPFSLFREFLAWIMQGNKDFIIMSNKNAITYKEVFPLLKTNKVWIGYTSLNGGRWMILPKGIKVKREDLVKVDRHNNRIMNVPGVCWMANLNHGKRHENLTLDTMAHNLKFNKKLIKKFMSDYGKAEYLKYDNYDAIEVPFVECIPSDYDGVMGVPITFIDKYNPEQFEIIGSDYEVKEGKLDFLKIPNFSKYDSGYVNGKRVYSRILIRNKHPQI